MSELTLYHLPPSPNNVKARLALGLKKIPVKLVEVDPRDRAELVRISGQPLSPVLVDGERVVYDSYAILRYLDANWPGAPRLFDADYARQKQIEGWELFARTKLGESVGICFGQFFSEERDPAELERARGLLAEHAVKVEAALGGSEHLMGPEPNAADLSVAAMLSVCSLDPTAGEPGGPVRFFAENMRLPASFERTHAWLAQVLRHDVARS